MSEYWESATRTSDPIRCRGSRERLSSRPRTSDLCGRPLNAGKHIRIRNWLHTCSLGFVVSNAMQCQKTSANKSTKGNWRRCLPFSSFIPSPKTRTRLSSGQIWSKIPRRHKTTRIKQHILHSRFPSPSTTLPKREIKQRIVTHLKTHNTDTSAKPPSNWLRTPRANHNNALQYDYRRSPYDYIVLFSMQLFSKHPRDYTTAQLVLHTSGRTRQRRQPGYSGHTLLRTS